MTPEPQGSLVDVCRDAQYRVRQVNGRPAALVMSRRTAHDLKDEVEEHVRIDPLAGVDFGGMPTIDGLPVENDEHLPDGVVVCTDLRKNSPMVGCAHVEYAEPKRGLLARLRGWLPR